MKVTLRIPKHMLYCVEHRPTEVYSKPCGPCPSMIRPRDPEAQDIWNRVASGEDEPDEYLFTCAWRRKKLCKGNYDELMEAKAARGGGG